MSENTSRNLLSISIRNRGAAGPWRKRRANEKRSTKLIKIKIEKKLENIRKEKK
jgi:hypothetical protein